jgi:hypothetical protein
VLSGGGSVLAGGGSVLSSTVVAEASVSAELSDFAEWRSEAVSAIATPSRPLTVQSSDVTPG